MLHLTAVKCGHNCVSLWGKNEWKVNACGLSSRISSFFPKDKTVYVRVQGNLNWSKFAKKGLLATHQSDAWHTLFMACSIDESSYCIRFFSFIFSPHENKYFLLKLLKNQFQRKKSHIRANNMSISADVASAVKLILHTHKIDWCHVNTWYFLLILCRLSLYFPEKSNFSFPFSFIFIHFTIIRSLFLWIMQINHK